MQEVPYANVIGSIMYAMICTRPDVAYSISILSRFISNPGKPFWHQLKWLMRYLNGTLDVGLCYNHKCTEDEIVKGYVDSDYRGCIDSRISLSGYVFAVFGGVVNWRASLQKVVALTSTATEYIVATEGVKETIWLKRMLSECTRVDQEVTVYCDSQSALHLMKNPKFHERSKHVDIKLHFIRDIVEKDQVKVDKIETENNPSDALTKVLPVNKFKFCMNTIQVWDAGGELAKDEE